MHFVPNKIKACIALLIILVIFNRQASADTGILFSSFFANKNLSSANIMCFFQDSKGCMWIGTHDGLNCFNGKNVKIFKHDYQDKNSLPDNFITSICSDQQGNIWVGTSWGISKLNADLLTFENYNIDDKGNSLGFKTKVYIDKEVNIWAFGSALFRFNKTKQKFEKKQFRTAGENGNVSEPRLYEYVFEDSQKRYWVSCIGNIYRYYPDEEKFVPVKWPGKKMSFFAVSEDRQGNLFCGTWNDGLYRINTATASLEQINDKGLYNCCAFQQLNGKSIMWCGNKLSNCHPDTKTFTFHEHNNDNPYSGTGDDVAAMLVDAQNQLWIGYANKGIQIVSPSNQVFKSYNISEKPDMFPQVNSFINTAKYCYVGGWYNYSLVRLDNKTYKPLKSWKSLIPKVDMTENNISDAWADHKGNIWLTSCFGLMRFNEDTEKTELFKLDSSISKRSHFLQMLPEGDSVLWLSGYFCGLSRFSLKTKTFQNWYGRDRALFWGITKDNRGIIWLADNSSKLIGFDPLKKMFISKSYPQLAENAIYNYVLFDSISDVLWVATVNGLLKVDRKTFKAKLFTEKDNLPTSQINALQLDLHHRLWIATNDGLCFYDAEQNVFKTFFSNNGLPSNLLNEAFRMQSNGELVIGCKDGFSVLQTNAVPSASVSQAVMIDKIYESDNIIPIKIKGNQKTIELNYDKADIRVEFYSNDLINPEDNQLLYRLEGHDNKWYTAPNGIVNYSKLAPGKYLFHASGINHTGIKMRHDDYLTIIIHPPFWKTPWFIILISAGVFAITLLAARYVFTRNLREKILILEKEQAIEKERSRISQDMHDELGSGLTKISIMSEVAMTQLGSADKAKNQLETISSSSRELVDNLQDIIWVLNSKNDSLENLCAYLQEYGLKYFEPFDISLEVNFPETIPHIKLSEDQRRNILLVFKESFNNISKHSGCTQVKLDMPEFGKTISFAIADNGRGFDKKAIRHFANGLQGMSKRMAFINGLFEISSIVGQGTLSRISFRV